MFVHIFFGYTFITLIKTQTEQNGNVRVVADNFDTQAYIIKPPPNQRESTIKREEQNTTIQYI